MKISVAVRTKFWGFQVAHQLQRKQMLQRLFTSYYGKLLGRDNSIGYQIPENAVKQNFISAIHSYFFANLYPLDAEIFFGQWVSRHLGNEDAVITWGLQAKPIITSAHQKGIKVILERGSSHVSYQRHILLEESRLFGTDTSYLEKSFSDRRMKQELWEYEHADLIAVPSQFVKQTFLNNGLPEEKIFVNNFGVDLSVFVPKERKDDTFRIIYTGQQNLRKGVQYLLRAFHELNLPDAELWLVGKPSTEMEPFLNKYHNGVTCFAPVPQHELAGFYQQCDVFAICSIEEGLALVQPQAMASGLPLICTTNTGGSDLISDGEEGFILEIRNVETLKEKIHYLYHNRDICCQMGQKARQKVMTGYSWENYGDRMVARYKKL